MQIIASGEIIFQFIFRIKIKSVLKRDNDPEEPFPLMINVRIHFRVLFGSIWSFAVFAGYKNVFLS